MLSYCSSGLQRIAGITHSIHVFCYGFATRVLITNIDQLSTSCMISNRWFLYLISQNVLENNMPSIPSHFNSHRIPSHFNSHTLVAAKYVLLMGKLCNMETSIETIWISNYIFINNGNYITLLWLGQSCKIAFHGSYVIQNDQQNLVCHTGHHRLGSI